MELGQQCEEKSLFGGRLEWVVAVHMHTRSVHWQSFYEVVCVPNRVVGVGWHKILEVSCSIRLQFFVGGLPSYQTRQDLFRAPKEILLINKKSIHTFKMTNAPQTFVWSLNLIIVSSRIGSKSTVTITASLSGANSRSLKINSDSCQKPVHVSI